MGRCGTAVADSIAMATACNQVEEQSLPAHVQVLKAEESKQLENIAAATAGAWRVHGWIACARDVGCETPMASVTLVRHRDVCCSRQ